MRDRVERITQALKAHDRMLFAAKKNGVIQVFRQGFRYAPIALDESLVGGSDSKASAVIHVSISSPHYIFSLTEDWTPRTEAVDWGIEPIMAKIKSCDLWVRDRLADELMESYEKGKESDAKDFRNKAEAFAHDFRSEFAKATNDVNTSTLS